MRCSPRTRRRRARPGTPPSSSTTRATSACSRSSCREDLETRLLDEARERALDELERIEEETGEKNHTLLTDDDLDIDWSQVPEDQIKREDVTPDNFGRIAAQTAKQVIYQRIREAEREMMYDEYIDRVTEVVTGIVQQAGDRNNVLVDLGKVEALLPRSEQVDGERYEQGSRIKAVITEVRTGTKGPQVILSRRDPELIKTLFELEVPEIADGLVEIRGVAREPGYRSKIAVESHAQGVDPVGACVGPRGSRVRMVVSELRGEKIDIIPWNPEPARFVAKALSPARVREVYLDDDAKEATVVVPDDQLALAIGKEGMNARLAHRLTGWKIDIVSDTEFAQQEADAAYGGGEPGDESDTSGRCAAILSNGKRCPNASLPGSKYCGVPAHQELALQRRSTTRSRTSSSTSRSPSSRRWPTRRRPKQCRSTPRCWATPSRARTSRPAPATRRSSGTDETLESGGAPVMRVEDDPNGGVPIEYVAGVERRLAKTTDPITDLRGLRPQGAAGRAPALPRGGRRRSHPARARARCVHLPPARVLRARDRASRFQPNAAPDRDRRPRSRAALHLRS